MCWHSSHIEPTVDVDDGTGDGTGVRTGKFRPDELDESDVRPDGIVSSIAQVPEWLERNL